MLLTELAILFIAGLFAGGFGTLVGGGNILTIPLAIYLGYPVHQSLAMNKLGTVGLTLTGYYKFNKKKLVDHKVSWFITLFAISGAYLGTKLVIFLDTSILEKIVALMIIVVTISAFFIRNLGLIQRRINKKHFMIGAGLSFILGLYIGFLGIAAGIFLLMMCVGVFGKTFLQGTATMKMAGLVTNIVSAIVFWMSGFFLWAEAITLFVSMSVGSYLGAHYSDRIGNLWLKRIFLGTSIVFAILIII